MEWIAGLALGLAGSLHCVGMCGPIAIALPHSAKPAAGVVVERLAYQFGRVLTYAMLGIVVGLGGSAFATAGYGRTLSLISGALMIVVALVQLAWHKSLLPSGPVERLIAPLHRKLASLLRSHGVMAHLGIGLLNGLLPCGLVTAALVGAVGTGSVLQGSLFMAAFGLGTVPLMSAVSIFGTSLSCRLRQKLRVATPAMAIIIGTLFLLRGMALGIPYVSPAASTEQRAASCH